MKSLFFSWIIVVFCARLSFTATPVEISVDGESQIGPLIAYNLKEKIRESSSLELYYSGEVPRMKVNLLTKDNDGSEPGKAVYYSAVFSYYLPSEYAPLLLTFSLGRCGISMVTGCADQILASLTEQADRVIGKPKSQIKNRKREVK